MEADSQTMAVTVTRLDDQRTLALTDDDGVVVDTTPAVLLSDPDFIGGDADGVCLHVERLSTGHNAAFEHDLYADVFEVDEATVSFDADTQCTTIDTVLSEHPRLSMQPGDTVGATSHCELAQKATYAYVTTTGTNVLFDPFESFEAPVTPAGVACND